MSTLNDASYYKLCHSAP